MQDKPTTRVKIALPKGKLWQSTGSLIESSGLGLGEYQRDNRQYRFESTTLDYVSGKMFHEKDIPVQVAVGNYDLGICGLDWVEELLVKYPVSAIVKVANLGYGRGGVYAAVNQDCQSPESIGQGSETCRIVTEYPNQAESLALALRLKRFQVLPVWGAAESYPPDKSDMVVVWKQTESDLKADGLRPLKRLFQSEAVLIANRESWRTKNMSEALAYLTAAIRQPSAPEPLKASAGPCVQIPPSDPDCIWLALPDGHQQSSTIELLERAKLEVSDYSKERLGRSPSFTLDWLRARVVRPQDMPSQVANGNFDLAVTGIDWLQDHLYRFPSSPVGRLLTFPYGGVRIVAVVKDELPARNVTELKAMIRPGGLWPLRVASEYVNIADRFVWERHLSPYRVIPTWGASEAFLPEDADLLIENSQTGKTLEKNKLRIIDDLFNSTACLVGGTKPPVSALKKQRLDQIVDRFRQASESFK